MSTLNKNILIFSLLLITIFTLLFFGLQPAFAQESESCGTLCTIAKILANPFDSLAGGLGNLLIAMTSTILYLAGSLFDLLIKFTIVEFADNLNGGLLTSITKAWEAFRDIGNIVIIGMFVFVAISTILGIEEYGTKKMISRLLIVAILINFSLFFTKAIIDASHITAKQFYNSMVNVAASSDSGGGRNLISSNPSDSTLRNVGISGAFMQRSGIVGGFDTQKFRERIVANNGSPFTTIIVYSVLVSLLMFTVSILFLYGSFLLASRGILLIILMITSSLAFASYLIPTFSSGKYGWKGWWDSLLKAAFMAPLLMIFLWATLFILQSNDPEGGTTVGKFLENPGDSSTWKVAWLLIITVGLLFASIKMSQALSSGITGFKISSKIPALATLGGALGASWLGKRTIGAGAGYLQRGIARTAKEAEEGGSHRLARRLDSLAQGFGKINKSDLNLANTGLGKVLAGEAGLKGRLAGITKGGGAEGLQKARDKKRAEQAERLGLSKEEKEEVLKTATDAAKASNPERALKEAEHKSAKKEADDAQATRDRDSGQYRQMERDLTRKVRESTNVAEKESLRRELRDVEKEHRLEMETQDSRIKAARSRSASAERTVQEIDANIDIDENKKLEVRSPEAIAANTAHQRFSNVLKIAIAGKDMTEKDKEEFRKNDIQAKSAVKAVKDSGQAKDDKRLLRRLKDLQDEDAKNNPKPDSGEDKS